jgi:hypothetical protein
MRKHKPKLRDILQNNFCNPQNCQGHESQGKTKDIQKPIVFLYTINVQVEFENHRAIYISIPQ